MDLDDDKVKRQFKKLIYRLRNEDDGKWDAEAMGIIVTLASVLELEGIIDEVQNETQAQKSEKSS